MANQHKTLTDEDRENREHFSDTIRKAKGKSQITYADIHARLCNILSKLPEFEQKELPTLSLVTSWFAQKLARSYTSVPKCEVVANALLVALFEKLKFKSDEARKECTTRVLNLLKFKVIDIPLSGNPACTS